MNLSISRALHPSSSGKQVVVEGLKIGSTFTASYLMQRLLPARLDFWKAFGLSSSVVLAADRATLAVVHHHERVLHKYEVSRLTVDRDSILGRLRDLETRGVAQSGSPNGSISNSGLVPCKIPQGSFARSMADLGGCAVSPGLKRIFVSQTVDPSEDGGETLISPFELKTLLEEIEKLKVTLREYATPGTSPLMRLFRPTAISCADTPKSCSSPLSEEELSWPEDGEEEADFTLIGS